MRLKNKTAVITGGATGIGLGIARALARDGCRVVISGRRENQLREAVENSHVDPPISYRVVDVADRESAANLINWADQQWGQIDIMIHSAGVNIKNRTLSQMRPEQWDEMMAINTTGAYNCLVAAMPIMQRRKDGLIVFISSIAGKRAGSLGGVAYNASKFALSALGISAANELATDGIRVTNIYPGEVETPLLEQRPTPVSKEHRARILQPEDLGEIVVTLASLPQRVHVPELIVKPVCQEYV